MIYIKLYTIPNYTCILKGFGIEATCLFALYFTRTGTMSMIFLTIGVASSGLSVSGCITTTTTTTTKLKFKFKFKINYYFSIIFKY